MAVQVLLLFATLSLLPIGFQCFRSYSNYRKGSEGEEQVRKTLSALDNTYYLLNDVKFSGAYANVDHIILAPSGIFVIETKNYTGKIVCKGDSWPRLTKYGWRNDLRNPSAGVRYNAWTIYGIVMSLEKFKESRGIWIQGIVVFVNKDAELEIDKPPEKVKVLKLDRLIEYINRGAIRYSPQELEIMGKGILEENIEHSGSTKDAREDRSIV
jgi:hypothetical protein